jgi:Carboxypeptidase regulatory-like domain/TonB-dependent Receptor Plug Domain
MLKKRSVGLLVLAVLVALLLPATAQETAVKGNLGGLAVDSTGAIVPGAAVTLTGPTGSKTDKTDETGDFMFSLLAPGFYSVKVEKEGFKTATVKSVEVQIGKTQAIRVTLEPGAVSEVVEVTAAAAIVDTTSTAVGANLPDTFYQSVPVARNVSSLFYITPGAVSGGGTGAANPSISGASGLENLYIADGVNITDRSFGGLGVFTRRQGSVGSGINLSFIKEVSVKSGGFEPQYGQATGGVVSMVTKSGSNSYHGQIGAYLAPQDLQAQALQPDAVRLNKTGFLLNTAGFDVDGELGGYVPGFKDHLFFFLSGDPTWNQKYEQGAVGSGLAALGVMKLQANVYNYAGKLTWKINDRHQIESSLFGDPTRTTTGQWNIGAGQLNSPNTTGFSRWNYGTRNWVVRYNGTLSPTWLVNSSFTWNNSRFTETPLFNLTSVTDRTDPSNIHTLQGFGFLEDNHEDDYALNIDTQKVGHWMGQHTLSFGYRYERPNYFDLKTSSGPPFTVPATNATGGTVFSCTPGDISCPIGGNERVWNGSLLVDKTGTCTLCPIYHGLPVYVQFGRGEWDPANVPTYGRYHAGWANDSWEINKHLTINAGLRWEQWRMQGTFSGYTFTDSWSPRIGVAVDPFGDHKTKVYANFGRYSYQTPLDAAIRSLSAEQDLTRMIFAPIADAGNNVIVNSDGTLNLAFDSAHLLNLATGGVQKTPQIAVSQEGFAPGTKMMYQNEWVVGTEHQFHNGVVLSARFLYRDMPRIVEDVSGVSPEASNAAINATYFIANPGTSLDLFPNANEQIMVAGPGGASPAACAGPGGTWSGSPVTDANGNPINPSTGAAWVTAGSGICFLPNALGQLGGEVGTFPNGLSFPLPDGKPDGFPTPVHHYKAVEVEVNKAFANNWMLRANWRIASLTGNYEGAFRNDNAQTDPNISSLFDFTNGIIGMLADQYKVGPLNTDRRHVVNAYVSYVFSSTILKNLELGTGVQVQSGTPISEFADHPAYGNAGEVPIGGRGKDGRTPVSGMVNVHIDRPFKVTEKSQLHLTADLFNITNSKPILNIDQNSGINFSPDPNPDFLKVTNNTLNTLGYQAPFYARFSFRWVF